MGYGGGFYDRTLAQLRGAAIGIAYAGQELPRFPAPRMIWRWIWSLRKRHQTLSMNILFLGDISESPAATRWRQRCTASKAAQARFGDRQWRKSAGGFGLTRTIAEEFFAAGIDVISTGNHWADQKEILTYIEADDRVLRPLNYPKGTPGQGRQSLNQTPKVMCW